MSDPVNLLLVVAIVVLLLVLRVFSIFETLKKNARVDRHNRESRAPKTAEERAAELSAIMRDRLGVDAMILPLDADWRGDLRIPEGEFYEFFIEVSQAFSTDIPTALEKQTRFRSLLEFLEIPEELVHGRP
jgi:hypothetical protein